MSSTTATPLKRVTDHLPLIEKIFLLALLVGTILMYLKLDSTVAKVSLVVLGATFFLTAFRPPQEIVRNDEDELFGFSDLLALMILPKVLWISSGISALGIALWLMEMGNEGYKQLLMIGSSSIAIATILLGIFAVTGVKHLRVVVPTLLRALPLVLIAFYILVKYGVY